MACIREEFVVEADAGAVWDAIRDVGAVHRRLVPGVVVATRLEPGARVVTFANGMVLRELIVDLDDEARRLAYAAVEGGRATHHHATLQVFDAGGGRARVVWVTDVVPDDVAGAVRALVEQGATVMKATLERGAGSDR